MLPPRVIWMAESTEMAQSECLGLFSVKSSPAVFSSAAHLTEPDVEMPRFVSDMLIVQMYEEFKRVKGEIDK